MPRHPRIPDRVDFTEQAGVGAIDRRRQQFALAGAAAFQAGVDLRQDLQWFARRPLPGNSSRPVARDRRSVVDRGFAEAFILAEIIDHVVNFSANARPSAGKLQCRRDLDRDQMRVTSFASIGVRVGRWPGTTQRSQTALTASKSRMSANTMVAVSRRDLSVPHSARVSSICARICSACSPAVGAGSRATLPARYAVFHESRLCCIAFPNRHI